MLDDSINTRFHLCLYMIRDIVSCNNDSDWLQEKSQREAVNDDAERRKRSEVMRRDRAAVSS